MVQRTVPATNVQYSVVLLLILFVCGYIFFNHY